MNKHFLRFLLTLGLLGLAVSLVAAFQDGTPGKQTTILYDGSLEGTPDNQGFSYMAFGSKVSQSYAGGLTTLDSLADPEDQAGYFGVETPQMDRASGYSLLITMQMIAEAHTGRHRAGFSLIVLSADLQGVELGFWPTEIFAQEGGSDRLFTHAEGAAYDTTTGIVTYELRILNDTYTLLAGDEAILTGPLRDYTTFEGFPDPYETANLVFMGDNTSRAGAEVKIAFVALETKGDTSETPEASPTPTQSATPIGVTTSTPTPEPTRSPFWWLPCVKN